MVSFAEPATPFLAMPIGTARKYPASRHRVRAGDTRLIAGDSCGEALGCSLISRAPVQDELRSGVLMFVRPRNLADRMSGRLALTLPVDAARLKAREILYQFPQGDYLPIVEN
jgi:hypothetical protein